MTPYREQIRAIWAALDWNKSDYKIAQELAVSPMTVRDWRCRITGQTRDHMPGEKYNVDWEKLDWSKNNNMLSRELGIEGRLIGTIRFRLNKPYPTQHAYNTKIEQEQIDSIDWEWENDIVIARRFKVSRERIRQLRNKLQKPQPKFKHCEERSKEIMLWLKDHRNEMEGKTLADIAASIPHNGETKSRLYSLIRRSGIPFAQNIKKHHWKFDWNAVNWKLPNIVLQFVYGFQARRFAVYRNQLFKGKPHYRFGGFSRIVNDPAFLADLDAEKKKAAALGITTDEKRLETWLQWKRDYMHPHTIKTTST